MKKLALLALAFITLNGFAQNNATQAPRKTIAVTGTAEMEIVPDEIYVSISLQEYKEGSNKIVIETLEKALRETMNAMKIEAKNLSVEGSYGYRNYIPKKHKQKDFFLSKTYQLKMTDLAKYNELIDRLNDEGISQVSISRTSHSKILEFKKQMRINAIKAAKEKAGYLLLAINEQLGEAVEVNEQEGNEIYPMYRNNRMENMKVMGSADSISNWAEPAIEMQQIKISSTISVVFAIK
ncbi:MAG: SIMPL domain-containing protein [Bacteroidia bacterium]